VFLEEKATTLSHNPGSFLDKSNLPSASSTTTATIPKMGCPRWTSIENEIFDLASKNRISEKHVSRRFDQVEDWLPTYRNYAGLSEDGKIALVEVRVWKTWRRTWSKT
jgi:hypothetical protein